MDKEGTSPAAPDQPSRLPVDAHVQYADNAATSDGHHERQQASGSPSSNMESQHYKQPQTKSAGQVLDTHNARQGKNGNIPSSSDGTIETPGGGRLTNRRIGGPQFYEPMSTITERQQYVPHGQSGSSATSSNSFSNTYNSVSSITTIPSTAPHNDHLTVEGEWKVEVVQRQRKGGEKGGVVVLAIVKWVVTIAMMLALLVCLISVKLSVLVLSKQLQAATPSGQEDEAAWTRYSAQFIVLYLLLSVPPLLNAVRAGFYGLLDSTVPWPSRRAVIWAVVRACLESLGLCLMCYKVLGQYDSPLSLLLLATPLFFPALDSLRQGWKCRRQGGEVGLVELGVMGVGVLLSLVGVVAAGAMLILTNFDVNVWHVLVAIVVLSLAWFPPFQQCFSGRQQSGTSPRVTPDGGTLEGPDSQSYGTFSTDVSDTIHNEDLTHDNDVHVAVDDTSIAKSGPTWKSAFVLHSCRVVFTFLVSALIYMLDSEGGPGAVFTDTVHTAFLDAWNLDSHVTDSTWTAFGLAIGAGLVGYVLAFGACHMNMMRGALAPPLVLATPLAVLVVSVSHTCDAIVGDTGGTCRWDTDDAVYVVAATVCFLLAPLLTFGWSLLRSAPVLLQQESVVFWVPGYNNPALDTYLLVNRRLDVIYQTTDANKRKQGKVFICTTMYREEEDEMRQLLESINEINKAQAAGRRCFESHITLDGGVRQRELSEFALTLVALLDTTLGVRPEACTKTITPYGMKLSWMLPGPRHHQMPFSIHLKDNLLVKNKKRWSQVMYMSYILDFLTEGRDEDSFILTTDADVVFTPDSVEALMDLMTRDHSIGAVCARTHPMGDGPLVWYQKFEYAIGHWFQKAAEHVLGSVLCAPGCFSVYRCRALADVLPKYARRVETAFDFLTKDMGEDRWLCTLMVQSGWRIEYCATSENRTNCPGHFDEFYKQRRRWIASTLANLMLIVKEWKYVRQFNHRVSSFFLLYQVLLLCSTLIGPSTIVLFVAGGMTYAWGMSGVLAVMLQVVLAVIFAALCIHAPQHVQLTVAKVYTFLYAVAMTAVSVGFAEQIVEDVNTSGPAPTTNSSTSTTTLSPIKHISIDLPISVTTLYFVGLVSIFFVAALLHLREFWCLAHGLWYLLCLPSGYLVLTIYSVCNITDSSWGTREQQQEKSVVQQTPWHQRLRSVLQQIFFCCGRQKEAASTRDMDTQTVSVSPSAKSLSVPHDSPPVGSDVKSTSTDDQTPEKPGRDVEMESTQFPVPVEDWLPAEMRGRYAGLFRKHGFDSTLFISGMTETELRRVGVTSRGHLHYFLAQVALIPAFEIEYKVPTNVDEWLDEIGLSMYRDNFRRNHISQPKEMEILKSFGRKEIERELGITKDGHVKRLRYAISMLRDPTEAQQKAIRMRQVIEDAPVHYLKEVGAGEYAFWERLKECCLQPDLKAFGLENEVKAKLTGLRNDWLLVLAVSNTLWLILITTLASAGDLTVLGANPLGLVFLVVFGALFIIQFLTMLQHRLATLSHFLARAPYRCGRPLQTSWSFLPAGTSEIEDTSDWAAVQQVKRDAERAWQRVIKPRRRRGGGENRESETSPLVV